MIPHRLFPTLLRIPFWLIALGSLLPAASPAQTSIPPIPPTQVLPLEYAIPCITFSPDGRMLWLDDQLWNLPSATKGAALEEFPKKGRDENSYGMAVSPDGRRLAFHRYEEVVFHEVPSGRVVGRLGLGPRKNYRQEQPALAFSPDGKELITLRNDEGLVRVWSLETFREVRTFPFGFEAEGREGNWIPSSRLSRDGKLLLVHMAAMMAKGNVEDCVLFDPKSGKELQRTSIHNPSLWIHFSSSSEDCKTFAYTADDTLHLMDPKSGNTFRKIVMPNHHLFCPTLSPDGRKVAACFRSKEDKNKVDFIQTWDTASGDKLQLFEGQADGLTNLCFSPDGKLLVSTSLGKKARLWTVAP